MWEVLHHLTVSYSQKTEECRNLLIQHASLCSVSTDRNLLGGIDLEVMGNMMFFAYERVVMQTTDIPCEW